MQVPPLSPVPGVEYALGGVLGARLAANEAGWLLPAPDANPGLLQMFRDRDRLPVRDLLPWAGEFAGKYLTSGVLCLRLTRSEALRAALGRFVAELVATQDEDGYLGAFPRAYRLSGRTVKPDGSETRTWDAWNHYHCLLGLLLWHEETGDEGALAACRRAADLFCRMFFVGDSCPKEGRSRLHGHAIEKGRHPNHLVRDSSPREGLTRVRGHAGLEGRHPDVEGGRRLVETGSEEMNLAPIHVFCLLFRRTGEARYLRLAREIEADFETPPAGDYVRTAIAGQEFYETPKPRWESLHAIQGIFELYLITGEERYRRAFEHIWWSIAMTDRHNTGGFSAGEKAQGNPYDPRPIETCCTIAWVALSVDMLRLTGSAVVADELELATFNAVLGAQSPSGRWWTYNTPSDGVRLASAHDIVFQARAGTPELNCCSVNGPRGLGMVSEWALMQGAEGTTLNYYGPARMRFPTAAGVEVTLTQETDYPATGEVTLRVDPQRPATFRLRLRIPRWSAQTQVRVNGEAQGGIECGTYLALEREWRAGDRIEIRLDFSLRAWVGEREAAGRASVYRGPLLLAYDQALNALDPGPLLLDQQRRLNRLDPGALPTLTAEQLRAARTGERELEGPPQGHLPGHLPGGRHDQWVTLRVPTAQGDLVLCDFASAGMRGTPYLSWLPFTGREPVAFTRHNPLRQVRL